MKKNIRLIFFALLLTVVSGCFPVLVPPGGGPGGRGGDGHHDGRGGGGGHERGDRH